MQIPQIENSFDLLKYLKNLNLLCAARDAFWWQNSGSFEVVIGAILTQNAKWIRVETSLENLRARGLLNLENLANCDNLILESLIAPSGLFRQKAKRLIELSRAIIEDFGDFDNFRESTSREWLLNQKGIGKESADSILNYALLRDVMVADKYTQKLLAHAGFEFFEYDDMQNWLTQGIIENYDEVEKLYAREFPQIPLAQVFARFHGKIVEYSKLK